MKTIDFKVLGTTNDGKILVDVNEVKAQMQDQYDAINALQSDRDALAAHCIRLKGFMQSCADSNLEDGEQEAADMYLNQVNLTPDYCLAAHDAEVAKEAFISGATNAAAFISQKIQQGESVIDLDAGKAADKYVAQLRAKLNP